MANGYISFALFEDKDTSRFRAIIMSAIIYVLRYWSNILLVFVPIGTSAPHVGCSDSVVFIVNCLAIISLADVLCRATDDVSGLLGETAGALLNVTMGNATEVVILYATLRD
jgi:Ca2+:H+ antiporter